MGFNSFFSTSDLKSTYYHMFLSLIPKSTNATMVDQFSLIPLWNIFFKVIAKILASGIRQHLEKIIPPTNLHSFLIGPLMTLLSLIIRLCSFLKGKKRADRLYSNQDWFIQSMWHSWMTCSSTYLCRSFSLMTILSSLFLIVYHLLISLSRSMALLLAT